MIYAHTVTRMASPSTSDTETPRFAGRPALRAAPLLAMLLLLGGACDTRPLDGAETAAAAPAHAPADAPDETDAQASGAASAQDGSFLPRLPMSCSSCTIADCPDGFSRVGPGGARGSFCIEQQQEPAASFLQAMTECATMPTSTGAVPHLCTMEEWYIACSQGPDLGEPSVDDLVNAWEWVAMALDKGHALAMGKGSCAARGEGKMGGAIAFRCCIS